MAALRRFQDVVLCFRDQIDERLRELQMSQMPLVSRVGADRLWQTRRVLLVSPAGAEWSETHLEEAAHTVTLSLGAASIPGSEEQATAVANAAADLANQVEGGDHPPFGGGSRQGRTQLRQEGSTPDCHRSRSVLGLHGDQVRRRGTGRDDHLRRRGCHGAVSADLQRPQGEGDRGC